MPTFDIVSEVDMQEVRNAVDQANREAATRFDFKGTDSTIELERDGTGPALVDRGPAAGPAPGPRGEAGAAPGVLEGPRGRQDRGGGQGGGPPAHRHPGRDLPDHAKQLNKFIKDLGLKGVTSQTQGDQLRVTGKKRDDLQAVIAACKDEDFGIPLQFENFRD